MKQHPTPLEKKVRRTFGADQVFSLEALDSRVFDATLNAVNGGDLGVAKMAIQAIKAKVDGGHILTPMTKELLERAIDVCAGKTVH